MAKHVIESALNKAAVGLGNVDNTADSAKPVSTLQDAAIKGRVPKGERWANVKDYFAANRIEGVTDDLAAFNAALATGRPVYAPAGRYYLSNTPDWSDQTVFVGDGKRKTILKFLDAAAAANNLLANKNLGGTVQMYFADFTLDGNCQRQGGNLPASGGSRSSTFTLRNVQHAYIDRVEAINPIQHGFDVTSGRLDYAYVGDGFLASLRSSNVYFDQCEASNFGDDGFTTHSSDAVHISRSISYNPRLRGNCNGFEIDGDSRYCVLTDNQSFNCYAGIEIKGHGSESAAMETTINGHTDTGSVRSYNFRHIGFQTGSDPVSLSAFGITASNLVSINPNNDAGFQDDSTPRALSISAYTGVVINGFRAVGRGDYGAGAIAVQVQYRASGVVINGLSITGWTGADYDVSLTTNGKVTINGLTITKSANNGIYTGSTVTGVQIYGLNATGPGSGTCLDIYNSTYVDIDGVKGVSGYALEVRADLTNHPSLAWWKRRLKDLPSGTTLLAGLDLTKNYYASSGAMGLVTDAPSIGGALIIEHSQLSGDATVQTATRNTTGTTSQGQAWRIVYSNATAGPWNISAVVQDDSVLDVPGGTTLLTALNLDRKYYGSTTAMSAITDGPGLGGANFIDHEDAGGDEVIQTLTRNTTSGTLQARAWRIVYRSNLTTGPWNRESINDLVPISGVLAAGANPPGGAAVGSVWLVRS